MRKVPAVGSKKRGDGIAEYARTKRRVVCLIDDDIFMIIRARALEEESSFAEQARFFLDLGIKSIARQR